MMMRGFFAFAFCAAPTMALDVGDDIDALSLVQLGEITSTGQFVHLGERTSTGQFVPHDGDVGLNQRRAEQSTSDKDKWISCKSANVTYEIAFTDQEWFWRNYCTWEAGPRTMFANEIRPGMNVLDVGAWIGSTALLFGRLVGSDGQVVAVEPSLHAYNEALDNVWANGDIGDRVTVLHAAMGPNDGKTRVSDNDNSMDRVGALKTKGAKTAVQMISISSASMKFERKQKADFVKIDIEGFESTLVPSATMKEYLKEHLPKVFVSLHPMYKDVKLDSLKAVVDTLSEIYGAGNCFQVKNNGELLPFEYAENFRRQYRGSDAAHGGTDIFCRENK